MGTRLLIACAASAAIVLAAPFIGQLQTLLRSSLSTRAYVALLGIVVFGAIGSAMVLAFVRIRERRGLRLALMAGAGAVGAAYTRMMSTGDATIDAVERFHFVEYGMIAVLFYRVWRPAGDLSTLVLPILCGFIVGTLDEWLQWFIPYRVGEMQDVFLNLTALVCGVLFGLALEPPPSFSMRLNADGWSRIGLATSAAVLVFGGFVGVVHLGYVHEVDDIGGFRSRHTVDELEVLQRDRSARWLTDPPLNIPRLSREDQYLDEGLWHVRERNRRWDDHEIAAAWRENLILERLFAPVLDRPTYASANGNRWLPEHRADAEARGAARTAPFVSAAEPYLILIWSKTAYWSSVGLGALLVALMPMVIKRRRRLVADATGSRAPTGP